MTLRPSKAAETAGARTRSMAPVGKWVRRSRTRVRSRRFSNLETCGPTPLSASTSVNSGLRISGRMYRLLAQVSALAMMRKSYYMVRMPSDPDLKRLAWRAHHRGTKEADMMIGGFFDAHHASWDA